MPSPAPSWHDARAALPACWQAAIGDEFDAPYMIELAAFLAAERAAGRTIYPPAPLTFAALAHTPLAEVRAVILGQDPYHRPGQAMGLAFSVPRGVRPPPSLRNILKEMQADIGTPPPGHGCLTAWTERGVLLLNASLTVEEGRAGSHARLGWHRFTDRILAAVNARPEPAAFVLWGNDARQKAPMLDAARHLVHVSGHPSPLAAHRGFFGSRPFSKVNAFLAAAGRGAIDWRLD
ncbi:uracil-DNA glycosylase [Roseicella aquatilis]|uniref:Uracil-DNA glycosylase n=1 Tax=Roseicella aquatilis TaxID=2527868 RepID=A0A4R4DQ96_9PROT|nr:uracil-DNA glycosylase [Roseicella aquatilis]TCZ63239.1 uracil-DNA glycosylase [Roseicella aquatilis]